MKYKVSKSVKNLIIDYIYNEMDDCINDEDIILIPEKLCLKKKEPPLFLGAFDLQENFTDLKEKLSDETWEKLEGIWFIWPIPKSAKE